MRGYRRGRKRERERGGKGRSLFPQDSETWKGSKRSQRRRVAQASWTWTQIKVAIKRSSSSGDLPCAPPLPFSLLLGPILFLLILPSPSFSVCSTFLPPLLLPSSCCCKILSSVQAGSIVLAGISGEAGILVALEKSSEYFRKLQEAQGQSGAQGIPRDPEKHRERSSVTNGEGDLKKCQRPGDHRNIKDSLIN